MSNIWGLVDNPSCTHSFFSLLLVCVTIIIDITLFTCLQSKQTLFTIEINVRYFTNIIEDCSEITTKKISKANLGFFLSSQFIFIISVIYINFVLQRQFFRSVLNNNFQKIWKNLEENDCENVFPKQSWRL